MIIGHGDIASALPKRDDLLFFASGVSNSQEKRESQYKREVDLLLKQDRSAHIVYFSSLAVLYSKTRYAKHKRTIEGIIKEQFPKYTILRIGNITWGVNPHTIINYFRGQIQKKRPIEVKNVYRYVVDKDELLHWIRLIPAWSCEMNVPGKRMLVKEIVDEYCYVGLHNPKV